MKRHDKEERAALVADRVCRALLHASWMAREAGEVADARRLREQYWVRWDYVFKLALSKYKTEE